LLRNELKKRKFKQGDILQIHRRRLVLTQAELPKNSSISLKNLSQYETRKKIITLDVAKKLASALSIHYSSLLFPNENKA
jgi:transcriptional regulator with XRE-family HTH domain